MSNLRNYLCIIPLAFLTLQPNNVAAQSITFEQVLADPDDPALNLQFAREQIAKGELQQAASALERLLLNRPNWDAVRLLYGTVLFRMDDLVGAKREFLLLEGRALSTRQEANRNRYLASIERSQSAVRVSGHISVGGRHDTNPGLVSDFIAGAQVNIQIKKPIPGSKDGSDRAWITSGRVKLEGDLPNMPRATWFVETSGYLRKFNEIDRSSTSQGVVKGGFEFARGDLQIKPFVQYGKSWLMHDDFSQRWGGGLEARYKIDPRFTLFAGGSVLTEDYENTAASPTNSQRDGHLVSGHVGLMWRPIQRQSFNFTGFAARKNAKNDGYSYSHHGVAINSLTLLGRGAYLTLSGRYTWTDFDQPDGNTFVNVTREDEQLYARAALGVPLNAILGNVGEGNMFADQFKSLVVQAGVSWSELKSSSSLIEYENLTGDVIVTKRFAF